jgi:hypothetical protein
MPVGRLQRNRQPRHDRQLRLTRTTTAIRAGSRHPPPPPSEVLPCYIRAPVSVDVVGHDSGVAGALSGRVMRQRSIAARPEQGRT